MKNILKIIQSKIKVDFGKLNNVLKQNSMSQEDIKNIIINFAKGYEEYIKNNPEANISQIGKQLTEYLKSKEANELINKKILEFIKENGSLTITQKQLEELMREILNGYQKYVNDNELVSIEDLNKYLLEYMNSEEAKKVITNSISKIIKNM